MKESSAIELDSLDENYDFTDSSYISSIKVQTLANEIGFQLVSSLFDFEQRKRDVKRVDGLIIGTGEADFTKGNTCYTLHIEGKDFQLLDVPGIEGNESNYVHHVKEAIAKAHMVIYVNGTNKKPEKTTVDKINSYLEYGTTVYPLVNVRGFADAYEFEEDRVELSQGGAADALKQTMDVLRSVLGEHVLIPGNCVQGLLAFSSLAYDQNSQSTTIHPSRDQNLAAQQRSYFKFFSSAGEMSRLSNIDSVADVVRNKISTFKEDIVESNKGKIIESLNQYLEVLHNELNSHHEFLEKINPEFEKCKVAFENASKQLERHLVNKRKNSWNTFFNELMDKSDDIVTDNYGSNDEIQYLIKKEFRDKQSHVENEMLKDIEDAEAVFQEQLLQAVERLLQDIKRVGPMPDKGCASHSYIGFDCLGDLAFGGQFELKDIGSMLLKIGSYAASGAAIGSSFPVIGTLIGGGVGAVVGGIMTAFGLLASKAKKIRKVQSQIRTELETVRDRALSSITDEVAQLAESINVKFKKSLMQQVDSMEEALKRPISIFEEQIVTITELKNKLESMPYGTIHAI